MFMICLSCLLIILCWILSAKNHTVFLAVSIQSLDYHSCERIMLYSLALDNQIVKSLSIQSIDQLNQLSSHLIIISMLTLQQCQLLQTALSICSFIKIISSFFSFIKFFLHYFFFLRILTQSISLCQDSDQIRHYNSLFCFVLCFIKNLFIFIFQVSFYIVNHMTLK